LEHQPDTACEITVEPEGVGAADELLDVAGEHRDEERGDDPTDGDAVPGEQDQREAEQDLDDSRRHDDQINRQGQPLRHLGDERLPGEREVADAGEGEDSSEEPAGECADDTHPQSVGPLPLGPDQQFCREGRPRSQSTGRYREFTDDMPEFSGVNHVAFTVRNLETSTAFYERVFGFAPVGAIDGPGLTRKLFSLPDGVTLGLTEHQTTETGDFTPFSPGLDHLGFTVGSVDELHAWAAHLTSAGIEHSGLVEASYGTALSFTDPDGIALEFFVGR